MAKFTASVPLKIRLPGGFEIDGATGATHRIPDSLTEEFARDQAPSIPGFAWVTQDETSAIANYAADLAGKYDKTGGTISGAVTVTGALVAQSTVSAVGLATLGSVVASALTATTGRFKGEPHFNVKAYGAVADGVTDDAAAIQAAISAATAAGGGTVYFPAGTYALASTLTLGKGTCLRGVGWSSTLFLKNASNVPVITVPTGVEDGYYSTGRTEITSLRIDGNGVSNTSTSAHGISITADTASRNTFVYMENVWVQKCGGSGVYIGAKRMGNHLNRVYSFGNARYGFEVLSSDNQLVSAEAGQNVRNLYINDWANTVIGGQFFQATGPSIYLDTTAQYNFLTSVEIDNVSQQGIYIIGDNNIVIGAIIRGASSSLDNGYPYIDVITPHTGNVVRDCLFSTYTGVTNKGLAGLRVGSACTGVFGPNQTIAGAAYLDYSYADTTASQIILPRAVIAQVAGTTSGQLLTSGTAGVPVTFESEIADADGFHDNVTNNTRLTVPNGLGGKYHITANIRFSIASTAAGYRQLGLRKNGVTTVASIIQDGNSVQVQDMSVSKTLVLVAGDYIEALANQNSGQTLTLSVVLSLAPELQMVRIGP